MFKSKSKLKEAAQFSLSLEFSNNLFQTFIIEIFEKLSIPISLITIEMDGVMCRNLLSVTYDSKVSFIMFVNKDDLYLNNCLHKEKVFHLLDTIERIVSSTQKGNVTLILNQMNFTSSDKDELIFFLNTEVGVKIFEALNNNDLFDFLHNFVESITKKEEKSKLTFYDHKPIASTNLCDLHGIADEITRLWVKHLMCVPGISELKAIAIVKVFPNLSSLMQVYSSSEFNMNEKENFLKDIEIENKSNNTKKKLGVALSVKIFKYFTAEDPSVIIN